MPSITAIVVAAASWAVALPAQQPQPEVAIYRTWRSPDVTLVDGFFRVDPALLGVSECKYGVNLAIRDRQGTVLKQEAWKGACPQQSGQLAAALETFQFAMPSTRFTVEISVFPEGQPDRKRTTTVEVEGLPAQPLVSDLILARRVGYVDKEKTGWTMRRGTIGIEVPSQLVVNPADPQLAFYMELYPRAGRPLSGTVFGVVKRPDGKELARAEVQKLENVEAAQPLAGTFPLAGLPQGDYTLEVEIRTADTTIVRGRQFQVTAPVVAGAGGRGWFDTLTDQQITEMFDAVVALLTKDEIDLYRSLNAEGKRTFLARQFGPQPPTPNDATESALDAYLARAAHVKSRFMERAGRGEVPAWLTARGRIWMKQGQPSSQTSRARPSSGQPYEIWHYTIGQGYVYLFADDTGMGHYRLIYSNDPSEQSVVDWDRYVGAEAISDLARLGIRPRVGGSGSSF